ncbi:MAG: tRNA (adenosine(37)-N6)-threonylcarbamoyltransferase complex ATPase subunit type 1 TsaE [Thermodesulfobacteriota bacterium]
MPPKEMLSLTISTLQQTSQLGRFLGETARPGDVFLLQGDLGAGKTTLTQAIGLGLEVPGHCYITSPTFSLLHEYPGRLTLYHFDLYRLADEEEILELGFTEILHGQGVSVVEWPDRLGTFTPRDRFEINLSILSESSRQATIRAHGLKEAEISRFSPLTSLLNQP